MPSKELMLTDSDDIRNLLSK